MSNKGPLKATDRRRSKHKAKVEQPESGSSPIADLFNDRRSANGRGGRAVKPSKRAVQ